MKFKKEFKDPVMLKKAITDMKLTYPLNFNFVKFDYFVPEMLKGKIIFDLTSNNFIVTFDNDGLSEGTFNFELTVDKHIIDELSNKYISGYGMGGESLVF